MSDSATAQALIDAAFTVTDVAWPNLSEQWKGLAGFDLSDDAHARMQFSVAVIAAAEGQDPPVGLHTMVWDKLRRRDPEQGSAMAGSFLYYQGVWGNWRGFRPRLSMPPLQFPEEALGVAFLDSAGLLDTPGTTLHGTYHLGAIQLFGSRIMAAATQVREMCGLGPAPA